MAQFAMKILCCVREVTHTLLPAATLGQYSGARYTSSLKKAKSTKFKIVKRKGEYLYGVAPCTAALKMNRRKLHAIYLKPGISVKGSKRKELGDVQKIAEQRKVSLHFVDKDVLERMSGKRPHQGVILDVDPLSFKKMDISDCQITENKRSEKPVWLVLDEIHDPMNLGAILRSAFFFGVDRVITTAKKCCPLTPTVSKASAGAMEMMSVYSVKSVEQLLQEAGKIGWQVLGTIGSEEESVSSTKTRKLTDKRKTVLDSKDYIKKGPTILTLGNEGHGLHREVEKVCTTMLTVSPLKSLPQGLDSLNVAVATGILLHCLQNNR